MTSHKFNIGLIGLGWAGERHARAVLSHPDRVQLTALSEIDSERLSSQASARHVPAAFTDYHALLAQPELDAVIISLPHHLHAEAATAALQLGLHVLIDKPLAASLLEADAMIDAAEASHRVLMVAENVRFDPLYHKAAELIQQGALGEIFLVRISREHFMHEYLRQRSWFLRDPAGGIMMSGGIHDFEILRMLVGEVRSVYAVAAPRMLYEMHADDTSLAVVEIECGIRAIIQESFSTHTPEPGVHTVVYGRDGSLWFYKDHLQLYRSIQDGQPERIENFQVMSPDTFSLILEHFLDGLDDPTAPSPITALEQRKPLAAVLAAYRSMHTGLPVSLAALESPAPAGH